MIAVVPELDYNSGERFDWHRTSSDRGSCLRLMLDYYFVGIGCRYRHNFGSCSVAGCLVYFDVDPFRFEPMKKRMRADLSEIDGADSLLVHFPVGIDFALNQLD